MLAAKHPAGLDKMTESEGSGWEDINMHLEEELERLRLKFATALQHHTGKRESKEQSLTTTSPNRYNAKRRHWRKTRIGI